MALPNPEESPTLSTEETATLFGCSPDTLYALVQRGEAPVQPLRLGRKLRWPTQRVLEALGLATPPGDQNDAREEPLQ